MELFRAHRVRFELYAFPTSASETLPTRNSFACGLTLARMQVVFRIYEMLNAQVRSSPHNRNGHPNPFVNAQISYCIDP